MDKDAIRKEIDAIDTQILDLLSHRIECAKEIGKMKAANGEEIYVPSRETLVFKNLSDKNGGRIDEAALRSIYREIISASISAEKRLMVAYLGPKATFTQQAAVKNFGSSVDYRPMPSIPTCSRRSKAATPTTASFRLKIRQKARSSTQWTCSATALYI